MSDCSKQFSPVPAAVAIAVGDFPAVSPDRLALSRKIGRGCHVNLPSPDGELAFSLSMIALSAEPLEEPLLIAGPYGVVAVAQGRRLLRSLCGIDIGDGFADTDAGTWLKAAALGRLDSTPFSGATELRLDAESNWGDPVALHLVLRADQHTVVTEIRTDAAVMLALLSRTDWKFDASQVEGWSDLPLSFPVLLATHHLTAAALGCLKTGDVIVPDTPKFYCSGEGWIDLCGFSASVQYQFPGSLSIITLEKKMHQTEIEKTVGAMHATPLADVDHNEGENYLESAAHDMAQAGLTTPTAGSPIDDIPEQALASLNQLPVALVFCLGQMRLNLGELCSLAPGCVLPVVGGKTSAIAIVASGRTLGSGELVDVRGQLGIRITQWAAA